MKGISQNGDISRDAQARLPNWIGRLFQYEKADLLDGTGIAIGVAQRSDRSPLHRDPCAGPIKRRRAPPISYGHRAERRPGQLSSPAGPNTLGGDASIKPVDPAFVLKSGRFRRRTSPIAMSQRSFYESTRS